MGTLDQAGPAPGLGGPGFAWRVLSPIGAVVLAFTLLVAGAGVLGVTPLDDDSAATILSFGTSLLLLAFGVLLWRRLPAHERRLATAVKHSRAGALGLGVTLGVGVVIGSGAIILAGQAIDPGVADRLEDLDTVAGAPWQLAVSVAALVILAPLGEELLFRGLLLRALVRRLRFWPAAAVSAVIFAAAHADAYVIWPRAITLVLTGLALAWIYRWRGYWAAVATHATVNGVASAALVATS